jgi:hypothetical protein
MTKILVFRTFEQVLLNETSRGWNTKRDIATERSVGFQSVIILFEYDPKGSVLTSHGPNFRHIIKLIK